MDFRQEYRRWLEKADADIAEELRKIEGDDAAVEDAFYRDLAFGTGGLRGVIGAGTNRMNVHTVAKASLGLARYILAENNYLQISSQLQQALTRGDGEDAG